MILSKDRGLVALRVVSGLSAVALLVWTFRAVDLARVWQSITNVGLLGLVLIAAPELLSLALECLGWGRVFETLGQDMPARPLMRVRVITEAVAQTLPLGVIWAESLKPMLLSRHAGVSASRAVAALVARKYLLVASQAVYVALLAACGFATLRKLARALAGHAGLAWAAFAVSAMLCLLAFGLCGAFTRGRMAERAFELLRGVRHTRWQRELQRRRSGFISTDNLTSAYFAVGFVRATLYPGFFFLCGWLCEAVETFVILRLLGVSLDFFAVGSLEVLLSFLKNIVFILPAGLGVQDAGYVSCLNALGVPDALQIGAAFMALKRGKQLLWSALGYLLWAADARPVLVRPRMSVDSG